MIIKKFTGRTEDDAVEEAKKELGSGVVVMNVKSVKRKGLLGSFRARMTEVTVALEEESDERFGTQRAATQQNVQQNTQANALQGAVRQGAALQNTAQQPEYRAPALSAPILTVSSQNIEKKLDSLQNLLVSQLQKSEQEKAEPQPEKEAETEKSPEEEEDSDMIKFTRLLYNTMLDNEVDEKYANLIMDEIDKGRKPNMPIDYILANTYQKMVLKFGRTDVITPASKGPKAVVFVGPTGVGKTTTIAKIASSFTVEEKKKVALLTADTYRIAAAEQLRTYANILEVPFRVIYTEDELLGALHDFESFDYIFLDTAGHSHQNVEQIEKMKGLIHCVEGAAEKQVFLVLSATTKYRDLLRIADNYRSITDFELIFTKLDETMSVGNLLNLRLYTESPIAYVTCGQNVPDDIEVFNPQKTVKQLLGGKR